MNTAYVDLKFDLSILNIVFRKSPPLTVFLLILDAFHKLKGSVKRPCRDLWIAELGFSP